MSRFFIERPIFATVIAVAVMLAGALALLTLPIAQYPNIAPPRVFIGATYPGADAATAEASVTQVIEQQLKGVDHLLYFSSTSGSDGSINITATFEPGTNADIAQVQVQNKLAQATPLLPAPVQQQGLFVGKSGASFLMVLALYDTTGKYSDVDISDYLNSRLRDPISRVNGVGNVNVFGGQYAMRIWLDPYKLNNFKLMPSDVKNAVLAQNVEVPAGQVGAQPAVPGQALNAIITAQSRLQTAEQFRDIVLKTQPDGSVVRLGDVARVEIGADGYGVVSRLNGRPASGIGIFLTPGANALTTAEAVKKRATELSAGFPPGIKLAFPVDTTTFIKLSIEHVIVTLFEAIALVVAVMFLFLQNWRVTLIPALAVPVVLLGTFGVLAAFGYSINTLTMFAMVLAIGLLVDDAIVVVENVERIMSEEGLSPKDATIKSMNEITGALVGIALVLSAVFLPMAFFPGSTGVIYRQFSVTIVSAMTLSVLVALVLTPALCASLLKPIDKDHPAGQRGFFGWFNRTFEATVARYNATVRGVIGRPLPALAAYGVVIAAMIGLFFVLPAGFLPAEDQGTLFTIYNLPTGAVEDRTVAVAKQVESYYLNQEKANIDTVFVVTGFSFAGSGQNQGLAFVHLRNWADRPGARNRAPAIAQRAMQAFSKIRDGMVFVLVPPAVQQLGNSSGFDLELQDRAGLGHKALTEARDQLISMASKDPILSGVRPNGLDDTPQLHVDIDQARAGALGLAQADINDTLSSAWGGSFINNFIDRGRVKQVYVQADAPFRRSPEDLGLWFVRGASGAMAPFSAFANWRWTTGPAQLERYNGIASMEIQGGPAPGQSTGVAMTEIAKLVGKLPQGIGFDWTGLSLQEQQSGSQAPALYSLSILVVFLCLAALYESWSIPLAVMLVIPLGVVGALLAATLRGFNNDIYFQVGMLTTIGLSAKNAILIVQFADEAERRGASPVEAAMEAARLRLRPILMTSLAFIAGVLPLAISTGAGAGSQNDIGTGVIGGMLSATILAIFLVPLFFVFVRRAFRKQRA
ncbi:efflux RND transporter permease subunit [Phenylobacterium montanum]|uniref:Efflux pump membrane transporter n=1 Tax=Phenylobacterium montanum TaxID=2823693 RepID=A0A975IXH1_9CAUL|nr:efflux RND transporter permease subunit [Caulobacter sp. S6]QUD89401.1 efflux RND transporter permease subunit [Caulobacter sp. S6]